MKLFHGHFDQLAALEVGGGVLFDVFGIHLGIRFVGTQAIARPLDLPARANPFSDRRGAFRWFLAEKCLERQCRHFNMNIDSVQHRPRDLGLIFMDLPQRTPAGLSRIAQVTAWARIHGGDQKEISREGDLALRS